MVKPILKVDTINDINSTEFEQLKILMREFAIDTYIREDLRFSNLERSEQDKIINNAIENLDNSELTLEDIRKIEERINNEVEKMKQAIDKTNCRCYVLKDGKNVIAFQDGFIQEGLDNEEKLEGHVARSYTKPDYRTRGSVITISGEIKEGSFSKILIEDLWEWFSENGVTHQEIGAHQNVFRNMNTYIKWGFIPCERCNGTIFMEKDLNNPVGDKNVLQKLYEICEKYEINRQESKSPLNIEDEIEACQELKGLPNEIRNQLVQAFTVSPRRLGEETLEEQKNSEGKRVTLKDMSHHKELGNNEKTVDNN